MRHLILSILVLAALLAALPLPPAAAAPRAGAEIDFAALDAVVTAQMRKHQLPGAALAVIDDGAIVYLKGYGRAGSGPMTAQTPMLIGSQSKSITALAMVQLAEAGKLDLNAPVQTYLPWFRVADEAASGQITLNHLLHHTSGLSEAGYSVLLPDDAGLEEAVRSLSRARLTAAVGTKHQYFNPGYSVLAYLIEIAGGQSYAETVAANIFAPLGMSATSADPAGAQNRAQGYSRLFGFAVPMRQAMPGYAAGAGYITSTAEDMACYALAILNDGGGLVSPQGMKRMLLPGLGSYGMGWYIVDGGAKIFHGGANETYHTEVNLYPRSGRGFVLMTNQGHQIDHFISAGQLTAGVEAVVLGRAAPPVSQGWSARWPGWGAGILLLALAALHTRNFLALRGWKERARRMSAARRAWDTAVSFLIPSAILAVILWPVSGFYGYRFNLLTSLAYMRLGLPDFFILALAGTLPDYLQGAIKVILIARMR